MQEVSESSKKFQNEKTENFVRLILAANIMDREPRFGVVSFTVVQLHPRLQIVSLMEEFAELFAALAGYVEPH